MKDNRCFMSGCVLNAEYAWLCSSPPVYTCKMHAFNNMEFSNKDHALKPIFGEPFENTREIIILPKCDSIENFNSKFKEEEKLQRNFKNISVEKDLEEKSNILESSKSSELERKLKICENDFNALEASVTLAYQDIGSNYHQKSSIFNIVYKNKRTKLLIYDTEIESQASIILKTPQPLSKGTCITQLPNGKLFCFGNDPVSGITLLIDENYWVQKLPSGTPCYFSSAIYFNNNIYCFGGYNGDIFLTLSSRFDLDRNQWNELTPMPKDDACCCSVIFNGDILISGFFNENLLEYSIDKNSFLDIPYKFAALKKKILINAERLYLIEYNGSIYESEIGSNTAWKKIANNSKIDFNIYRTYCQYNKEEIYIGCIDHDNEFSCFKFKLNKKRLTKLV